MQWEPSLDRHTLGHPNLERDSLLIKNTAECWAVTAKFCYSGLWRLSRAVWVPEP